MSKSSLKSFLAELSQSRELQQRFQQNPDAVAAEYGLSDEEKDLVRGGNQDQLNEYLGDDESAALVRSDLD